MDAEDGGIHLSVTVETGEAVANRPKHYILKEGFHSYEHAFINYLSAKAREDGFATLFFARDGNTLPDELTYGFDGDLSLIVASAVSGGTEPEVQSVLVSNLGYTDTAPSVVPLPASAWLLLGAGFGLTLLRQARST